MLLIRNKCLFFQALLCQHCAGPVITEEYSFRCSKCRQVANNDDIKMLVERLQKADELWERGLRQLQRELVDGMSKIISQLCLFSMVSVA
jgi:hypothetical protein